MADERDEHPLPDAALNYVVTKYREFVPRDGRSALANALVETMQRFPIRDLQSLQELAGCVDAVDGYPEPDRIDAIAEDVWRHVGPVDDEEEDLARAKPKSHRTPGKSVRGVRYRGHKRDRAADPYYVFTPANVVTAVEEGRLKATVIPFATTLYQHIRRTERARKDKTKRITFHELATKLHRSEASAKRAIRAMTKTDPPELFVVRSGRGNAGAIYRFPPRAWTSANRSN